MLKFMELNVEEMQNQSRNDREFYRATRMRLPIHLTGKHISEYLKEICEPEDYHPFILLWNIKYLGEYCNNTSSSQRDDILKFRADAAIELERLKSVLNNIVLNEQQIIELLQQVDTYVFNLYDIAKARNVGMRGAAKVEREYGQIIGPILQFISAQDAYSPQCQQFLLKNILLGSFVHHSDFDWDNLYLYSIFDDICNDLLYKHINSHKDAEFVLQPLIELIHEVLQFNYSSSYLMCQLIEAAMVNPYLAETCKRINNIVVSKSVSTAFTAPNFISIAYSDRAKRLLKTAIKSGLFEDQFFRVVFQWYKEYIPEYSFWKK